jgi:cation:H+ antiporter
MIVLEWIGNEAGLIEFLSGLPTYLLLVVIAVCVVLLSKGADWMIDGVVQLAERTGLPRVVIGATVISLGTTAPEAFVSVMAAFMGNAGLALGNGVGSIIADTGLIFGMTCLVARVPVPRDILNRTGWVQVSVATLLVAIAVIKWLSTSAPVLGRGVGIFFLILLAGYLFLAYQWARNGSQNVSAKTSDDITSEVGDAASGEMSVAACWGLIVTGLFLVVSAARILVPAASEIAVRFGVPNDVIAATMVAFGTSLPELMTAVASIRKGYPEITVGNIVGADVLNCLFVIGAAATARPLAIEPNFYLFHFPVMLIILWSFRLFITINRDGYFKRWQGAWLLGVYLTYIILQYG